jgi:hypothetical protein
MLAITRIASAVVMLVALVALFVTFPSIFIGG